MATAVYPGSFDPVTLGHVDIIKRSLAVFDELVVLVSKSHEKKSLFSSEERKGLIESSLLECLNGVDNIQSRIKVDIFSGLTVDYLKEQKKNVIIRGIRAVSDFEYELTMANMNKKMAPDIETLVVFASPKYHYVSSRAIKEVARFGGPLEDFVPMPVKSALIEKYRK